MIGFAAALIGLLSVISAVVLGGDASLDATWEGPAPEPAVDVPDWWVFDGVDALRS